MFNDLKINSGLIWGKVRIDTIKEHIVLSNIDKKALIEEYREYVMTNHNRFVNVFDGAKELFSELHKLGVHIGVVTSKRKDVAFYGLKQFGLDKYCEILVDCDDVKNFKPHPEGVLKALEYFNVSPCEALMVGDSKSDMLAGKNAGMKVCAVEDNFSKPQEELKRALADYYIQDYDDIKNNTYEVL